MVSRKRKIEADGQEAQTGKKGPGRPRKKQALANIVELNDASRAPIEEDDSFGDPFDPEVPDSVLADSLRVRRWLESVKGAKPMKRVKYTPDSVPFLRWKAYIPITQTIIKLEEMPIDVAGRDFQVDKVEEFNTSSGRDSEVTSWAIYVNDRSNPRPQPFVLYKYRSLKATVNKKQVTHADGPIEKSFCHSKQDAEALGSACCKLLNKLPCPLQEDKWGTGTTFAHGPIYPRRMVEVLALDLWRPGFDYGQLHESFIEAGTVPGWFRLVPTQASFLGRRGIELTAISFDQTDMAWAALNARDSQRLVLKIPSLESLDFHAIERQIHDTPSNFLHTPTDFPRGEKSMKDLSQSQQECVEKLVKQVCFEIVGRVGTREQLQARVAEIIRPLLKKPKREKAIKTLSGVFGGSPLFTRQAGTGFTVISPSAPMRAASSKHLPSVAIRHSRLVVGHAMNAALHELKAGRTGLQAWHAMVLALAAAEAGIDSQADILQAQWVGITDNAEDTHIRACMLCNEVRHYADLIPDDEGRLVCQLHHPEEFELLPQGYSSLFPVLVAAAPATAMSMVPAIAATSSQKSSWKSLKALTIALSGSVISSNLQSIRAILQKEEKGGGFPMRGFEDAIHIKLRRSEIDPAKGTWQDAYNGEMDISKANYSGHLATKIAGMRMRPPHPDRPSMDAVHPFWYSSAEGGTFIHHPDNVTLTSWLFNLTKAGWPVSVLPLLGQAAVQANIEQNKMKAEAKTLVQVRDWSFWEEKQVQMEHIHRIASTVSTTRKTRLEATVTQESFNEYVKAWRTGVWSTNLAQVRAARKYTPRTAADVNPGELKDNGGRTSAKRSMKAIMISKSRSDALPPNKEYRKFWPEFTAEQKKTYARLIQDMRKDTDRFNPDNIEIRTSADGAPWPFPDAYYLDEEDDWWHWWYRFGLRCYWRVDDECDLENETQESPATIMLLFVERYFATGGGFDEFLHLQWVPWELHPCKASVGRAGSVPAGSHMRTGWTKIDPDSLDDFNPTLRTVTVQCWVVNHLWYNWPTEMHPELLERLMNIAESNQWYEKPSNELQSMPDFYPRGSQMSRSRSRRLRPAEQAEEEQVAEEPEDVLDEDIQDTPLPFDNVNDTIPGIADNEGDEAGEDAAPPPGTDAGARGIAGNEGGETGEGAAPPPGADIGASRQDLTATIESLQKQLQSLNDSVHKNFFDQAHSMEYSMLHQGLLDAVEKGDENGFAEQSAALQSFLQSGIMPAGAITTTGTADEQDDLLSCVACGEKGEWTVMRACENNHGLVYWHVSCEEDGEGCPSCAAALKANPDTGVSLDKDAISEMMAELKQQQESLKAAQVEAEKAHKRRQKEVRDQEVQAEEAHQRRQKEMKEAEEQAQEAHQRRQKEAQQTHIRQKLSMLNLEVEQNNAQIEILRQQVDRYEERNTQLQTEIGKLQQEEAELESPPAPGQSTSGQQQPQGKQKEPKPDKMHLWAPYRQGFVEEIGKNPRSAHMVSFIDLALKIGPDKTMSPGSFAFPLLSDTTHVTPISLVDLQNIVRRVTEQEAKQYKVDSAWLDIATVAKIVEAGANGEFDPSCLFLNTPDLIGNWLDASVEENFDKWSVALQVLKDHSGEWPKEYRIPPNTFNNTTTDEMNFDVLPSAAGATRLVLAYRTNYHLLVACIEPDLHSRPGKRIGTIRTYNSWNPIADRATYSPGMPQQDPDEEKTWYRDDGTRQGVTRKSRDFPMVVAQVYNLHPSCRHWKQDDWKYEDANVLQQEVVVQDDAYSCGPVSAYHASLLMRRTENQIAKVPLKESQKFCQRLRDQQMETLYQAAVAAVEDRQGRMSVD